jgi:hypothetical protein
MKMKMDRQLEEFVADVIVVATAVAVAVAAAVVVVVAAAAALVVTEVDIYDLVEVLAVDFGLVGLGEMKERFVDLPDVAIALHLTGDLVKR